VQQPTIHGLHAVVLFVKDLEKQKKFYRDVLGLEVTYESNQSAFLKCGEQMIALFTHENHPEGASRLEGAVKGISHLEFRIKRSDKEYWLKKLRDAGYHAYKDNFEDEDGNLFHFVYED
jgi:catechol 2,3-dioxygenase-like lactoylglutathione lyase family enzyme